MKKKYFNRRSKVERNIGKGAMQRIDSFNLCEGTSHYLFEQQRK